MNDFSPQAKQVARQVLGMADDEPNAATGFQTRRLFERYAARFDARLEVSGDE